MCASNTRVLPKYCQIFDSPVYIVDEELLFCVKNWLKYTPGVRGGWVRINTSLLPVGGLLHPSSHVLLHLIKDKFLSTNYCRLFLRTVKKLNLKTSKNATKAEKNNSYNNIVIKPILMKTISKKENHNNCSQKMQWDRLRYKTVGWLVGFYGISSFMG